MADKSISELVAATAIGSTDLFVLEQSGTAKKLTGQILENWLVSYADGHGGIQSIVKTSSTGTDPVIDTYTITYADTTTSTFTVTNGLKGDTGAQTYIWIKYSAEEPTQDSDIYDTPDDWIGIYVGLASSAPTSYTAYTWYNWKGPTGDPAELQTAVVTYQASVSGTTIPAGEWVDEPPYVAPGFYLWTKVYLQFNTGDPVAYYTVSRYGVDGQGSPGTATPLPDSAAGAIGESSSFSREDHRHPYPGTTLQASVEAITANGTASHTLTGLTADFVVANWGIFSDAACTAPISATTPPCDITITTAANSWSCTIANFASAFYLRPTFVLKQN